MIILALDALDVAMVQKFQCTHLMQHEYGPTDISNFQLARTVVLWASFLTGQNMEAAIPVKTQWQFQLKPDDTFLQFFPSYKAIDVPAFSYKDQHHAKERTLLKRYFEERATVDEYNQLVWHGHQENRQEFLKAIHHYDLVVGYFNLADAIGHLSFGLPEQMKAVYHELETLIQTVEQTNELLLVISDHGMTAIGRYGDHTQSGFYSTNRPFALTNPSITDFYPLVKAHTQ